MHPPAPLEQTYAAHYASRGISYELFAELVRHVAQALGVPEETIRPGDRFFVELRDHCQGWDSGYGILVHELAVLAKSRGIGIARKIESLDDYIVEMARVY